MRKASSNDCTRASAAASALTGLQVLAVQFRQQVERGAAGRGRILAILVLDVGDQFFDVGELAVSM
ncbi:MAG: hypothetical protein U0835_15310 [Isosphaeraceae bacterium]